jgi:hypothetical protein
MKTKYLYLQDMLIFIFTRHAYSCNNLNNTIIDKIKYTDPDPSISIWGLINTYKQGLTNKVFLKII